MVRRIDVATLLRLKRRPLGQTFLLVSIALVVVLGMAALAVDVGDLWTTRRLMQSAADAGAVAGADEVALGGDSRQRCRIPQRLHGRIEPSGWFRFRNRGGSQPSHFRYVRGQCQCRRGRCFTDAEHLLHEGSRVEYGSGLYGRRCSDSGVGFVCILPR
jgi:Putative Flp pilus-assembly TadE/G-like